MGTFTVQLAVACGARVIGSASESNHEQLRSLGAEHVTYGEGLVARVRAIAPQGVDAVLDASGRGEIPDSIELAGGPASVLTLVAFDAADTGIQVHMSVPGESGTQALRDILSLLTEGRLRVRIRRTFPLEEAAATQNPTAHPRTRAPAPPGGSGVPTGIAMSLLLACVSQRNTAARVNATDPAFDAAGTRRSPGCAGSQEGRGSKLLAEASVGSDTRPPPDPDTCPTASQARRPLSPS
ncbi:zinc-binding dehydrogenase [Streptomyces sp. NPDC058086]|uniref:zinc-binding dehydrogenase n=1 Tax=Streptomyces sp. NPDC058086 TaxID=3346334 RepID=UPI0036E9AEF0